MFRNHTFLGLLPIERRKILRCIKHDISTDEFTCVEEDLAKEVTSLHYGVYKTENIEEKAIDIFTPKTFTLLNLTEHILSSLNLKEHETVELYSKDGYPLHNNEITNSGDLTDLMPLKLHYTLCFNMLSILQNYVLIALFCFFHIVSIQNCSINNSFVFAIVRKRNQPRHQQFATLPALDHTIGMRYVFQCTIILLFILQEVSTPELLLH